MSCTCPFEKRNHKELSLELSLILTKPKKTWKDLILRRCTAGSNRPQYIDSSCLNRTIPRFNDPDKETF